jgi:hypothetical protein
MANPTNVWDVTQPPDTQLANLLGQDLRTFRLDAQQRMALISGLAANIWNPGTDAQPANWTGLLYFATDTGHIFQWSGAAWVDITISFIPVAAPTVYKNNTAIVHTGDTNLDTIYTVPIAANFLGINGTLRIKLFFTYSSQTNAANTIVYFKYGGSTLGVGGGGGTISNPPGSVPGIFEVNMSNRGVTNSQLATLQEYSGSGACVLLTNTVAVDSTQAQNLLVQVQNAANTDSQTFNQLIVESL